MDMMLKQFKTIFDRPEKIKKLRETILDLAVRGKLVSQDPNDEPAIVLLERIREEKERLIKDKKIKKEKSVTEIALEEVNYELPKGWKWIKLGDIGITQTGTTPSSKNSKFFNGYIPFIKPSDITHNGINYMNETLTEEGLKAGRKIEENSLLMVCIGTIGKAYFTDRIVSCNQQINTLTCLGGISAKFIYYFTQSNNFKNKIMNLATGTTMLIVNKSKFESVKIPLPPLSEQKRIVEKVDYLMDFCDKLEKVLEKKVHYGELSAKSVFNAIGNVSTAKELEDSLRFILLNFKDLSLGDKAVKELKNCILQLAVQGKLVEQDPNDEPAEVLLEKIREENNIKKEKRIDEIEKSEMSHPIPDTWKYIRLNEILISTDAGKSPTCNNRKAEKYEFGVIKTTAIQENKFLSYENKVLPERFIINDSYKIRKNDILITRAGPKNRVGIVCCVENSVDNLILSDKTVRLNMSDEFLEHRYVTYALNSKMMRGYIESKMTGMAESQVNISQANMRTFIIPLPPLNEQKRIVEKVDSLMALCDELEKKIEKQKDYSNRLMKSILESSFKA